jgi:tRNA1Val (adenine37-N6)-methyltransferase
MGASDFLKDIKILQNEEGYRFSMDALLVYSFVNLPRLKKIADLGAGSGVIGLLLARDYPKAAVTLIELQAGLAELAKENVALNNLQDRVSVVRADIKHLEPTDFSFDLVVSNPPFRRPKTGKISPDDEKAAARHEIRMSLRDLTKAVSSLLRHHGRFCVIHLPERLAEIITAMRGDDMEPKRIRFVHSFADGDAKMVLIEAVKGGRTGMKVERPLVIYTPDGGYTDEMKAMYGKLS